jgi:hypothetical protein
LGVRDHSKSVNQSFDAPDAGSILCGSHTLGLAADIPQEGNYPIARPHLDLRLLQRAIGTNPVLYFRNDLCSVSGNEIGFAAVSGMERIWFHDSLPVRIFHSCR